jgi:hypothetical protein
LLRKRFQVSSGWVQALIEHKSAVRRRSAAKEDETRFRIEAYAARAVFVLQKTTINFCSVQNGFSPLARFASGDVTMALTRCQVTRDE